MKIDTQSSCKPISLYAMDQTLASAKTTCAFGDALSRDRRKEDINCLQHMRISALEDSNINSSTWIFVAPRVINLNSKSIIPLPYLKS